MSNYSIGRHISAATLTFVSLGALLAAVGCDDPTKVGTNSDRTAAIQQKLSTSSKALVNLVGYVTDGPKLGVVIDSGGPGTFIIVNAAGTQVWPASGTAATVKKAADLNSADAVNIADFTAFKTAGTGYKLRATVGTTLHESETFSVSPNVYGDAKLGLAAMKYFVWKACGQAAPADASVNSAGHAVCHANDSAMGAYNGWRTGTFDVAGGWHDAGDHTKYLENQALAAWQLLNLWERTKDVADSNAVKLSTLDTGITSALPDLVAQIAWGTRWVRGTLPNPATAVAAPAFTDLAANKCGNTAWPAYPSSSEADTSTRYCMGPTTSATYSAARNLAHAARVLKGYGTTASGVTLDGTAQTAAGLADKYWATAKEAYKRARAVKPMETTTAVSSDINWAQSPGFNVASGPYQDDDMSDDMYAAAAEMMLSSCVMGDSTLTAGYKADLQSFNGTARPNYYGKMAMYDWGTESPLGDAAGEEVGMGTLSLLAANGVCGTSGVSSADITTMKTNLSTYATTLRADMAGQNYPFYGKDGVPVIWGSNASQATAANVLVQDYEYNGSKDSLKAAYRMMDYLLGVNPMRTSYVIGFGMRSAGCCAVTAVHDRPMNAAKKLYGTMVGGPLSIQDKLNPTQKDPATPKTGPALKRFANTTGDGGSSWESEENAVNWNSALAAAAWGLQLYSNRLASTCASAADCNDNNACTTDSCTSGVCSSMAKSCDDGKACTQDSCNTATGTCVNASSCCASAADCNDNDTCTTDACDTVSGACSHAPNNTCVTANVVVQSKGDATATADNWIKTDFILKNADTKTDQTLSNVEVRYYFKKEGNAAFATPLDSWGGLAPATRSIETAQTATGVTHFIKMTWTSITVPKGGQTANVQVAAHLDNWANMDDANDYSYSAATSYTANPKIVILVNGVRYYGELPSGDVPVTKCTSAASCNDANLCTDDICNADGTCSNPAKVCDDGVLCTTETCDPAKGCVVVNNSLACESDNNSCTTDVCNAGTCTHVGINGCTAPCTSAAGSSDGNGCTLDVCTNGVCSNPPKDCNDGNPCTNDSCSSGTCVNTALASGTSCTSDGDTCTTDSCSAGQCTHVLNAAVCECRASTDCAAKTGYTVACNANKCVYTAAGCTSAADCAAKTGYTVTCTAGSCVYTATNTTSTPCAGLCAVTASHATRSYSQYSLNTAGVCEEYVGDLGGGNCGNMDGRTFKINGTLVACGANWSVPAKRNGGYCFQAGPGGVAWAYYGHW